MFFIFSNCFFPVKDIKMEDTIFKHVKGCLLHLASLFISLKESTCETNKNAFHFLQKLFWFSRKWSFGILDIKISWIFFFRYQNFQALLCLQRIKHNLYWKMNFFNKLHIYVTAKLQNLSKLTCRPSKILLYGGLFDN